jgi:hypothetical protein
MRFHGGTLPYPAWKVNRLNPGGRPAYGAAMKLGPDQDKQRAAQADLARLRHAGDALSDPFSRSGNVPARDPIEFWGRRIGRMLSAIAFVALCIYLYAAYVR